MFWRDRPVLVTGASGLQGGWLVRALLASGADVVALVRDWVPQSELCRSQLIESVRVVRGDVRDQGVLERLLGEYEVKTVFHLAAQTIVPIANRNPISTFESNIQGTWVVLEACRRSPCVTEVVLASSDKAYGEHERLPYIESYPLIGRHPYDVSKSCADLLARSYAETFGLPAVITRCGNLYGGGDLNWSRIVPGTIRSVLRDEPPVIRSDGKSVRDYFYVEDGAAAYLLAAERLAEDRQLKGEAFNFSNETPLTVLELVGRILKLMKRKDLTPEVRNEASHEIPAQYLDAKRARTVLGWTPQFSLDEGLARTIRWYEEYFKMEAPPDGHAARAVRAHKAAKVRQPVR
jgi:CDP-glucose 4,6-dehydratase